MKKWLCVWIGSVLAALLITAAVLLTHGVLEIILCIAVTAAWGALFLRFLSIRYRFGSSEITITSGFLFRYEITIKRSEILSQSRSYLGRHLICTVIRTAGKRAVLFCELCGNDVQK